MKDLIMMVNGENCLYRTTNNLDGAHAHLRLIKETNIPTEAVVLWVCGEELINWSKMSRDIVKYDKKIVGELAVNYLESF